MSAVWQMLRPPGGRSARRVVAGIMLIMGLGRLGLYQVRPLADTLPQADYGLLLTLFGVLLYINGRFRRSLAGRVLAGLGALLMAGLAWDAAVLGVTSLIEGWMALVLLREIFTSYDC